jgi:hypothetical protein
MHGFGISTTETGEGLEAVRIQMLRREKREMCKIKIVVVHLTCQLIITVIIRKLNSLSLKKGFAFRAAVG